MIFWIAKQTGLTFIAKKSHRSIHTILALACPCITCQIIFILIAIAKTLFTRTTILKRKSIMKCVTFLASFTRVARLAMTYKCVFSLIKRAAGRKIITINTRAWTLFTSYASRRRPIIAVFASLTIVTLGITRATQTNAIRRTILTPTMTIAFLARGRIKIAVQAIIALFASLILIAVTLPGLRVTHICL